MKKLGPLTFSGDFRLREDAFYGYSAATTRWTRTCKITGFAV